MMINKTSGSSQDSQIMRGIRESFIDCVERLFAASVTSVICFYARDRNQWLLIFETWLINDRKDSINTILKVGGLESLKVVVVDVE